MPSHSPALLTVRDAAARLGVTPRTLKYYEERGLVTPTRSEGRYRLYDERDLEQFARILRLRAIGFSLHGITEMLKRPLETVGDGRRRYSQESLQQIADALEQQIGTLDTRIADVRRELKEAQTVRAELAHDLDYLKRRLAGEPSETLIDERLAAARRRKQAAQAHDNLAQTDTGRTASVNTQSGNHARGKSGAARKTRPAQKRNGDDGGDAE
ncbi:MerR family transcriptional regulator [Paraburkholderia eburnea]|uniref:MerR family transcriptional regulator n=1 Tax=Paraburkholderia eburnea TaxID=1189126 RepID=A0A2S4M448_9BURK|nr:MerR family transcriptional regulator [Paraburkholderia eburnea]POR49486.1 MerR family transcriptional regulator [Paraburkholderia eburnea]PRZ19884.1 MerR family transcriptional regulator [Paraburkholderia eburnea]